MKIRASDDDGVDIRLADPYRIPLPDASVDIVLSGQMLEHNEFFWLTFLEMSRVLKMQQRCRASKRINVKAALK